MPACGRPVGVAYFLIHWSKEDWGDARIVVTLRSPTAAAARCAPSASASACWARRRLNDRRPLIGHRGPLLFAPPSPDGRRRPLKHCRLGHRCLCAGVRRRCVPDGAAANVALRRGREPPPSRRCPAPRSLAGADFCRRRGPARLGSLCRAGGRGCDGRRRCGRGGAFLCARWSRWWCVRTKSGCTAMG